VELYVHGSVHCESVSIIVRDATIYSFIKFLQTAQHVSDDTLIHYQEHPQNVITSGTHRTIFVCYGPLTWRISDSSMGNPEELSQTIECGESVIRERGKRGLW